MFIAAQFTIAWTWKQPRCPSADEWIRKLWYIYTMEYYSAIKKNAFDSILMRWMKLEPIIQSKVNQKVLVAKSCLTLCDPMGCSPLGSSIHGISQARILEWVAISFSRESSQPRDRTRVSGIPGRCFNLSMLLSEITQSCLTLCDPMDSSLHQAPPSMGFSRQEY